MLTYKRKLMLTPDQEARIGKWIATCRFIYNISLEIKIVAWKNRRQSVNKFELMKQLPEIKNIEWIKDVPSDSLQDSIDRMDKSYQKFFNGSGFPKWANKRGYKSITFKSVSAIGNVVTIPKMGAIKMAENVCIKTTAKRAIIVKEITGYFICITTNDVKNIQNKDESQVVGLDMGVKYLYVDSNGHLVNNPKHFYKYEQKTRNANRSLARKKKGSNRWNKQRKALSILHHTIANVRRDFLHKESSAIASQYHTVVLEDLNIKGMVRNRKLSKQISDAGWKTFRTMLEYKTKVIYINPKFTSQTCSNCGSIDSKSRLSQSVFTCTSCGNTDNADINAAKNILCKGIALNR